MDHKVIWTDPAIEDLRAIVAAIAQADSHRAQELGNTIMPMS
jgi:plasmid stabilization system protein ParE